MNKITVQFKFLLDNGETHVVTVKDIDALATEEDILAVGNKIIESRGQHKGIAFKSLIETAKEITTREVF